MGKEGEETEAGKGILGSEKGWGMVGKGMGKLKLSRSTLRLHCWDKGKGVGWGKGEGGKGREGKGREASGRKG